MQTRARAWSIEQAAQTFAGICCAALTVLTLIDILCRPLRVPFFLASELNGVCMAWTVFFALAMVTRQRGHLRVEFLLDRMAPNGRRVLEKLADLLTALYIGVLVWVVARMAYDSWVDDIRSQGILSIPEAYAQFGVVFGLVLALYAQIVVLFRGPALSTGPERH